MVQANIAITRQLLCIFPARTHVRPLNDNLDEMFEKKKKKKKLIITTQMKARKIKKCHHQVVVLKGGGAGCQVDAFGPNITTSTALERQTALQQPRMATKPLD